LPGGDPKSDDTPAWTSSHAGGQVSVMRWDVVSAAEPERHRERYLFHDRLLGA
jgi:hypothetical protein